MFVVLPLNNQTFSFNTFCCLTVTHVLIHGGGWKWLGHLVRPHTHHLMTSEETSYPRWFKVLILYFKVFLCDCNVILIWAPLCWQTHTDDAHSSATLTSLKLKRHKSYAWSAKTQQQLLQGSLYCKIKILQKYEASQTTCRLVGQTPTDPAMQSRG